MRTQSCGCVAHDLCSRSLIQFESERILRHSRDSVALPSSFTRRATCSCLLYLHPVACWHVWRAPGTSTKWEPRFYRNVEHVFEFHSDMPFNAKTLIDIFQTMRRPGAKKLTDAQWQAFLGRSAVLNSLLTFQVGTLHVTVAV